MKNSYLEKASVLFLQSVLCKFNESQTFLCKSEYLIYHPLPHKQFTLKHSTSVDSLMIEISKRGAGSHLLLLSNKYIVFKSRDPFPQKITSL